MLSAQTFAAGPVRGRVGVPGDKSISHRAAIAAASIPQAVHISNLNGGRDVRATLEALDSLGVEIERDGDAATVRGGRLRE